MTETEILLVTEIMERYFGRERAMISRVLMDTGEMPIKELHRRTSRLTPRISSKSVKDSLNVFFQHNLIQFHMYPDFSEDAFISFTNNHAFFLLIAPTLCYAVEEVVGVDAARAVSVLLGMGISPAENFFQEFEQDGEVSRSFSEKTVLELLRSRIFTALDVVMKYDSEDLIVDFETVVRKPLWAKYALRVNCDRLYVVFLLYLTQSKVEADPAVGLEGPDVFQGLCRACLFSTALRRDFICDELFLPVTASDVVKNLPDPETSFEGLDLKTVSVSLQAISNLVDGFLHESGGQYTIKGAKLLGIWAEHFLYDTIRADIPHVTMARSVMQYLVRSHKPHVQCKALELELYGNSHAMRHAVNDLFRLGFVDLMGTSHVASFEPGRTEVFLHVNLPKLYRQKLQFDLCRNFLRNFASMDSCLLRDKGTVNVSVKKEEEGVPGGTVKEKFEKMESASADGLAFSLLYLRATAAICEEQSSRDAYSLLEFFGRNSVPEEMQ